MCGIVGIWTSRNTPNDQQNKIGEALKAIQHRGPNNQQVLRVNQLSLGHARLSVIDTSAQANQPFVSEDENYMLVFNGEIYNYKALRKTLREEGIKFKTESDTEVLLHLLILKGEHGLNELDGFFAFAFYDKKEDELLLARDRMGIKPLYYAEIADQFAFSSELSGVKPFLTQPQIGVEALNQFIALTYIYGDKAIFESVKKLEPGCYLKAVGGRVTENKRYYTPKNQSFEGGYAAAQKILRKTLTTSVTNRMVADVPLGCFLSGGVDSSIIAALAIKQNPALQTFSISFDHPYFNEATYAQEVAEKIKSNHTVYTLTQRDFKENFSAFLAAIDEPFADSSAFAVYLLAKKVRQNVTVALSGDGADELFGGYRKHKAEFEILRMKNVKKIGIRLAGKVLKSFKNNRSDKFGDFNRKLQKLTLGLKLPPAERYWNWCKFVTDENRKALLHRTYFMPLKNPVAFDDSATINATLKADQQLVLPNDMLKKVDLMSMANALEVRTPFLDHKLVEFANSLPAHYKISTVTGKRILKDTFADLLPESVINRSKKGFEIPIKEWLGTEIENVLKGSLFSADFIKKQGIFNFSFIQTLINEWNKPTFGDRIYIVWELIVFQHWYNRNINLKIKG